MITATVTKKNNVIIGFELSGHADYAEMGSDIICAATSALTVNTVNSIMSFTDDRVICDDSGEDGDGHLKFTVINPSDESVLLMDSLELGLKSIIESYGKEYLTIVYSEVL